MVSQSGQNIKQGRYIVISGPSGGGKTTIIKRLLENRKFTYSISATSRQPRNGEKNGEAYWFHHREEFIQMCDRGEFLEWEEVYGEYYGTPRRFIESAITKGLHVIFDLDVKGALRFKKKHDSALLIFLVPPSMEILEQRLKQRSTESGEELEHRLAEAQYECHQAAYYDHAIVNNDLESTVKKIEEIIENHIKEDMFDER